MLRNFVFKIWRYNVLQAGAGGISKHYGFLTYQRLFKVTQVFSHCKLNFASATLLIARGYDPRPPNG